MDKQIHPNFIKSSNLIFGIAGLGVINFFFTDFDLSKGHNISIAITTLLLIAGSGYLVRQGKDWIKYLLLVVAILDLIILLFVSHPINQNPVVTSVNFLQNIMQIWATILLFKTTKATEADPVIKNS